MEALFSTPKLEKIYKQVAQFLEEEIYPIEVKGLQTPFFEFEKILQEKRKKVRELGLWGIALSEEEGGLGLSLCEFGQISELLGHTPFGHYVFNCQAPDIGNMELMIKHASKALKDKYLHPLMEGKIRSCFSMTEPHFAGSNPVNMGTMTVKEGDNYVINGHKWFTSSADGAAFTIVMTVTNPEASRYQRASMLVVPMDNEGLEFVRNIPLMGDVGEGYMSHAELKYNNCTVPKENIIGAEGSGFLLAQERLGPGRIHHCMRWIGICERSFEMMCQRAVSREIGDGVMLGHKQFVQGFIAESRAEIDAARLMVLRAAKMIDEQGASAVRTEISTIKFFVADILQKVVDRAIQVHGALGMTEDTLLSFWYRHERGARIYDGADEVHKSALARRILKGYGLK